MTTLIAELVNLLGDRLSSDEADRLRHGRDVSYHPAQPPDAVTYPTSVEEVQSIVSACHRHRTPLIPYGAGTSLEGQIAAPLGGICIDLSRMNRILEVNVTDLDAVIEAGVTRQQLNRRLESERLFFSVDPGAEATIGGMASTRASGTNSVRYGTIRDNVLGLQVVLADGRVIHTGGRSRKSSAGYDLTRLFIGAEGTLGVITGLTVCLHPAPESISAAVCRFPDTASAVDTVVQTIRAGVPVARIELLDAAAIDAVNRYAGLSYTPASTLFFEFHGSEQDLAAQAKRVEGFAHGNGGSAFQWTLDTAQRNKLWHARHEAYYACRAMRPEAEALTTDVCVPISNLASCIAETQLDVQNVDVPVMLVGHVGDGNFHLICLIDPESAHELDQIRRLNDKLVTRALAYGGTSTGEHGVGIGKRKFLEAEHGEGVSVMIAIKKALDPHNLMNPTKIVTLPDS